MHTGYAYLLLGLPLLAALAAWGRLRWRGDGGGGRRADAVVTGLLVAAPVAAVAGLLAPSLGRSHFEPLLSFPLRGEGHAAGVALLVDRLSLCMLAVTGFIGAVVHRYAVRFLTGEARRERFLAWLVTTVSSVQLLLLSGDLLMLAGMWMLVSLALHQLLVHYRERERAVVAARKKFLVSRLGDVAMLTAVGLLFSRFGTLSLPALFDAARGPLGAGDTAALASAGLALAVAAACKSAQVPVHSWLPDTLESPTPVSALMHAGVVNAGGYLLIRLSPLLAEAGSALTLLVILGTLTAGVGMLVTWTQPEVKRALAWSTVSQMGFMILQCGLGAFSAALVHLVGHGFYKAHAFLASGTLSAVVSPRGPAPGPGRALGGLGLGLVSGTAAVLGVFHLVGWTGSGAHAESGTLLLGLILVIALAQAFVPTRAEGGASLWAAAGVLGGLAALAALLTLGAHAFIGPVLGRVPELWERGAVGAALTLIVPALFLATAVFSALLPWLSRQGRAVGLYVHGLNGFYLGILADRLVRWLWPPRSAARS